MTTQISTDLAPELLVDWAEDVARFMLEESLPRRWQHTLGVVRQARWCASWDSSESDELLVAAAYLHDIGYSPEIAKTGFHPLDGANFLREFGQERLAALTAFHSGAIYEAEIRGLKDELLQFENENSFETAVLTWCDMQTGPDGERVTVEKRLNEVLSRYSPDDVVHRAVAAARPELERLCEQADSAYRYMPWDGTGS